MLNPIQRKEIRERKKDEREKPLLFKRHKVVRFLISPKKKKVKIEVNKIMNPAFLLGTAFNIAYWHRKYHSGTICKGVSKEQTSNALSGCDKEEIPKLVWRRYIVRIIIKPNTSFWNIKGKNGILLLVEFLKGLLEDSKCK